MPTRLIRQSVCEATLRKQRRFSLPAAEAHLIFSKWNVTEVKHIRNFPCRIFIVSGGFETLISQVSQAEPSPRSQDPGQDPLRKESPRKEGTPTSYDFSS